MKIVAIAAAASVLAGCAAGLTTSQRRSIEVRELEGSYDDAFRATMSVLQDMGYVIRHTDYQSGVIQAETGKKSIFWESYSYAITATLEQFGENRVRERITVVKRSVADIEGQRSRENTVIIENPLLLENIYDRIQREIFVRRGLGQ